LIERLSAQDAGAFWRSVRSRSQQALRSGALQPIDTRASYVTDQGVAFIVRLASNLSRKQAAPSAYQRHGDPDPFSRPEADLRIGDLGPRHIAVLNKFNVIEDHVLVVTRQFHHQESPLTAADFAAVATGLAGGAGLAFYNAGPIAGASQPHKHFQLVPLPLGRGPGVPMASLFQGAASGINTVAGLAFQHAFLRLDADPAQAEAFGAACQHAYHGALQALKLQPANRADDDQRLPPYNLLLTDHWLFMAPRRTEHYRHISINGLGYAGSLFVSSADGLEEVKVVGPMTIISEVSIPRR